jgi:hypothetical protein
MNNYETSYIIVKVITKKKGKPQHVFLVDGGNEILEFNNEEEAKNIAEIFETNSDNGWSYYVKKI